MAVGLSSAYASLELSAMPLTLCDGFYHITGAAEACVLGGVLVLLLSSVTRFFFYLPLILFSALVRQRRCSHVNAAKAPP